MSYSPVLGRWMQQDPEQYVDGPNLYEAHGDNPVKFVDPQGTDRYVGSDAYLHNFLVIDMWGKTPQGAWMRTGKVKYEFGAEYDDFKHPLTAGGACVGSLLFAMRGRVTRTGGTKASVDITIKSSPEADMYLIGKMDAMVADPPWYNLVFHNCNHWVAEWENVGIEETDPRPTPPAPPLKFGDSIKPGYGGIWEIP